MTRTASKSAEPDPTATFTSTKDANPTDATKATTMASKSKTRAGTGKAESDSFTALTPATTTTITKAKGKAATAATTASARTTATTAGKPKARTATKKVEGAFVTILAGTTVIIRTTKQARANATATEAAILTMAAATAIADSKAKANKPKTKKQRQEQSIIDSIDIRRTTIGPLDIPETLTQAGFFLLSCVPNPRGEDFGDGDFSPFLDRPKDILSCMLVSKHWYQVMVPILWRTCLAPRVRAVPKNTLERFLPHIRILETGTRFSAVVLQCTRLLDLALSTKLFPDMCFAKSQSPTRILFASIPA